MAPELGIRFYHSIYDFRGRVSGLAPLEGASEDPIDRKDPIRSFITGGDSALYRENGYFFDVFDSDPKRFVFAELVEWGNQTDRIRNKECFFDVYATNVDSLETVSLVEVVESLRERGRAVTDKNQSIEPEVSIVVRDQNPGNTGTSPTIGNSYNIMELRKIAELWEHYHRGSEPLRANLKEVDFFKQHVAHSIEHLNFVSHDRKDPYYFDIVEGSRQRDLEYEHVVKWLQDSPQDDPITWASLPRYEDLLDKAVDDTRSQLEEESKVEDSLQSVFEEVREDMGKKLNDSITAEVSDVFNEGINPSREIEALNTQRGGMIGTLTSRLSGSSEDQDDIETLVHDTKTDSVSGEEVAKIADRLLADLHDDLVDEVEETLRKTLYPRLVDEIEDELTDSVEDVVRDIHNIRQSRPYKVVNDGYDPVDDHQQQ